MMSSETHVGTKEIITEYVTAGTDPRFWRRGGLGNS